MKFSYVVGNPPYQQETSREISLSNRQAPTKNIFHFFQLAADQVAEKGTTLIYPGKRWLHRSGKGLEQFGLDQINDPHLKRIVYYPHSADIFDDVTINDGLTIVVKDMNKENGGFTYDYSVEGRVTSVVLDSPGETLIPLNPHDIEIVKKVEKFAACHGLSCLHERILPRSLFGIESDFIANNPSCAIPLDEVEAVDFVRQVKLFTNDKAGSAGRTRWFLVDGDLIPKNRHLIGEWQVIVSSANPGGQRRDNQMEIVDNHSAFGRARVALASFQTEVEAKNFVKFAETDLVQYLFLLTDEALTSVGKRVLDLGDYSNENSLVDFDSNMNDTLNQLIGLTEEEIKYMQDTKKRFRQGLK